MLPLPTALPKLRTAPAAVATQYPVPWAVGKIAVAMS